MNPTASTRGPLLLVDGTACVYRAFHALPELSTADGRQTHAVRGAVSIIRRLCRQHADADCVVVFDAPGKTFRHRLYPDYKATRPPMPDGLREQLAPTREILAAMGLPLLSIAGVEADDVIGALALNARERPVIIVSGDKDLMQLIDERVSMFNTNNNEIVDPAGVERRFGVGPRQIPDYLALVGDKSDNIPGVSGVGEKTAVALLRAFGSLDALYRRLEEVPSLELRGAASVAKKLERGRADAMLSRDLATIRVDVDGVGAPEDLAGGAPDTAALAALFEDLEFRGWRAALDAAADGAPSDAAAEGPSAEGAPSGAHTELADAAAARRWAAGCRAVEWAVEPALDAAASSLARVLGLALAADGASPVYIPLADAPPSGHGGLDAGSAAGALRPLLEAPGAGVVAHDVKRALGALAELGIAARPAGDPMLSSYLLRSADDHGRDAMVARYLPEAQAPGAGAHAEAPAAGAARRAGQSLALHRTLSRQLDAEPARRRLLEELELPLASVLSGMERVGVLVDTAALERQGAALERRIDELAERAWDEAGERFNLNSPQQLQRVLYERLGLRSERRTTTGQPSTAEPALQGLAHRHPLPGTVLEHRELSKLLSTYVRVLPRQVNPRSGRVHTTYHQAVASTGRLSSSNPNLQNIPIRSAEGRRVREAFVAAPGRCLVSADYSQVELRVMAHVSQDERLIQAFRDGLDIHRSTAAEVFGADASAVSAEQRRRAKAINFGIVYGMSEFGLARRLGISVPEAGGYIERYFARYPGVRDYMRRQTERVNALGYVETPRGRRIQLPAIRSPNHARRRAAERAAINAPVQGAAADIIKQAMLDIDRWLGDAGVDARMTLQVHDELVLECAGADADAVGDRLGRLMASAAELSVPLAVEVGSGANWGAAH